MALGATAKDILLSFAGRGLALTLAGLIVGLFLAVLAAVSLILLSAHRASCVDPVTALQHK